MPSAVVNLAVTRCSMGVAPMPITVMPKGIFCITPAFSLATILDAIPMVNIKPYVLCSSPVNPAVAAIIAATLGAVQKGPCVPVTMTWMPMAPTILVRSAPILTQNAKLYCMFGGMVEVVMPGQMTTQAK